MNQSQAVYRNDLRSKSTIAKLGNQKYPKSQLGGFQSLAFNSNFEQKLKPFSGKIIRMNEPKNPQPNSTRVRQKRQDPSITKIRQQPQNQKRTYASREIALSKASLRSRSRSPYVSPSRRILEKVPSKIFTGKSSRSVSKHSQRINYKNLLYQSTSQKSYKLVSQTDNNFSPRIMKESNISPYISPHLSPRTTQKDVPIKYSSLHKAIPVVPANAVKTSKITVPPNQRFVISKDGGDVIRSNQMPNFARENIVKIIDPIRDISPLKEFPNARREIKYKNTPIRINSKSPKKPRITPYISQQPNLPINYQTQNAQVHEPKRANLPHFGQNKQVKDIPVAKQQKSTNLIPNSQLIISRLRDLKRSNFEEKPLENTPLNTVRKSNLKTQQFQNANNHPQIDKQSQQFSKINQQGVYPEFKQIKEQSKITQGPKSLQNNTHYVIHTQDGAVKRVGPKTIQHTGNTIQITSSKPIVSFNSIKLLILPRTRIGKSLELYRTKMR